MATLPPLSEFRYLKRLLQSNKGIPAIAKMEMTQYGPKIRSCLVFQLTQLKIVEKTIRLE